MTGLIQRLIHRVMVEEAAETDNGQGGRDVTWQPLGGAGAPQSTMAAEVYGLSGSAAFVAGLERDVNQWRVTIRRRDDVTAKHRLQWLRPASAGGPLLLEIKSVMPDPKMQTIATLLLCESGA